MTEAISLLTTGYYLGQDCMTASQNANIADFDPDSLLRTAEGDESLAVELCRLFAEQSKVDMAAVANAIQEHESESLGRALHKLKGAAVAVCANRVAALSAEMGTLARSGDWSRISERWIALQAALQKAVAEMNDCIDPK